MARYRRPLRDVISSDGASRAMKFCDCEMVIAAICNRYRYIDI